MQADSRQTGQLGRSTVLGKSSAPRRWPLAPWDQLLGNQVLFPFQALQKWGNLVDSILDFLGYIKMTRTHLGEDEKPRIEERVKKKRRASGQFQISALLLQVSALFTSSISSNLLPSQFIVYNVFFYSYARLRFCIG